MIKGMEKISEAILDKVHEEARVIIAKAEAKAAAEVEKAHKLYEKRIEEEKRKLRAQVDIEAARTTAQASIKARQELLRAKSDIIEEIVRRVKDQLARMEGDEQTLKALLLESIKRMDGDRFRVYVAPKHRGAVGRIVGEDKQLSERVEEIKEDDFLGGIIVEDTEGRMRIDNSYDTRLAMLLPQVLPSISKELFPK